VLVPKRPVKIHSSDTLDDTGEFNITHPKIPDIKNKKVDQKKELKFLFIRIIMELTTIINNIHM
jgi:hypothetical protein